MNKLIILTLLATFTTSFSARAWDYKRPQGDTSKQDTRAEGDKLIDENKDKSKKPAIAAE